MTRLYLPPSGGTPGITPTPATEWDFTTGFGRVVPSLTKTNTAPANQTIADTTATLARDALGKQFVYPLPTGIVFTTSDTFKGQVMFSEAATGNNLRSQLIVRVIASNGTTVQATLYAGQLDGASGNPTNEFGTTIQNREIPAAAPVSCAANYTSVAGDHLVIEVGYRKHAAASTTGTLRLLDNNASDLADGGNTGTTDGNSWFETTANLEGSTPKAGADTATASTSESGSLSATAAGTDTTTVSATESGALAAQLAGTETATVSLTDAASLAVAAAATDTMTLALSDTAVLAASDAVADTVSLSLSEAATVQTVMPVAGADSVTMALSEMGLADAGLSGVDATSVSVSELASVEATEAISSADTLSLAVTDGAAATGDLATTDAVSLALSDMADLAGTLSGIETIALTVTESPSAGVPLSGDDLLGVAFSEVAVVVIGGEATVPLIVAVARPLVTTGVVSAPGSCAAGAVTTLGMARGGS